MKSIFNNIQFIFLLGLIGIFVFSMTAHQDHWSDNQPTRIPASSDIFKYTDPQVFKDYFGSKQSINIKLWNSKNKPESQNALKTALNITFKKVLSINNLKNNPLQTFSKEFLHSLAQKGISKGIFQIDIQFTKKNDKSFSDLLNNENTIDYARTGYLLKGLTHDKKSITNSILETKNISSKKKYQFQGGIITLWFNIEHLSFTSENILESQFTGFIKYRRYFKMNRSWLPSIYLEKNNINLLTSWQKADAPKYLTVDLNTNFIKDSFNTMNDNLEISFGTLIKPIQYKGKSVLSLNLFSRDKEINKLLLSGVDDSEKYSRSYVFSLSKLIFDFSTKRFSLSSRIKSKGVWTGFRQGEKSALKKSLRQSLLGDQSFELIQGLNLIRFHKVLREVRPF